MKNYILALIIAGHAVGSLTGCSSMKDSTSGIIDYSKDIGKIIVGSTVGGDAGFQSRRKEDFVYIAPSDADNSRPLDKTLGIGFVGFVNVKDRGGMEGSSHVENIEIALRDGINKLLSHRGFSVANNYSRRLATYKQKKETYAIVGLSIYNGGRHNRDKMIVFVQDPAVSVSLIEPYTGEIVHRFRINLPSRIEVTYAQNHSIDIDMAQHELYVKYFKEIMSSLESQLTREQILASAKSLEEIRNSANTRN